LKGFNALIGPPLLSGVTDYVNAITLFGDNQIKPSQTKPKQCQSKYVVLCKVPKHPQKQTQKIKNAERR